MSTLKVDSIENGGAAVNFPADLAIGAGTAIREYYAQAGEPNGAGNGAVWWDTANSVYKLRVEGEWYTVGLNIPATWYGDRATFAGGVNGGANINTIDYFSISTLGNAADFGNLTAGSWKTASASNSTIGLFQGSAIDVNSIVFATLGNATYYGYGGSSGINGRGGCSDGTYGLFGGGSGPSNVIDYVVIATTGSVTDFGDLTVARNETSACADATYGVWAGGSTLNTIDYVTIATPGNAIDFGDLTQGQSYLAGCSNTTRGLFGGSAGSTNTIEYITIATPGNAVDFGDLTVARGLMGACTDGDNRAVFGGGDTTDSFNTGTNVIDYVTIATPGNATDFGDLFQARGGLSACSGA